MASPEIFYLKNAVHREMLSRVAGRYSPSRWQFSPAAGYFWQPCSSCLSILRQTWWARVISGLYMFSIGSLSLWLKMPQVCSFVWERLRPKSSGRSGLNKRPIVYANNKNINKLSAKKKILFLGIEFLQDKANRHPKNRGELVAKRRSPKIIFYCICPLCP